MATISASPAATTSTSSVAPFDDGITSWLHLDSLSPCTTMSPKLPGSDVDGFTTTKYSDNSFNYNQICLPLFSPEVEEYSEHLDLDYGSFAPSISAELPFSTMIESSTGSSPRLLYQHIFPEDRQDNQLTNLDLDSTGGTFDMALTGASSISYSEASSSSSPSLPTTPNEIYAAAVAAKQNGTLSPNSLIDDTSLLTSSYWNPTSTSIEISIAESTDHSSMFESLESFRDKTFSNGSTTSLDNHSYITSAAASLPTPTSPTIYRQASLPNNSFRSLMDQQSLSFSALSNNVQPKGIDMNSLSARSSISSASAGQLAIKQARKQSESRISLPELYSRMGLAKDHDEARIREQRILTILRQQGFKLGERTWIRDTTEKDRRNIIDELFRQTYEDYGYSKELLEVIVRRGSYYLMQGRLRRIRRGKKVN